MSGPSIDNDAFFKDLQPPPPEGWDWKRYRSTSEAEWEALPEELQSRLRDYRHARYNRWHEIRGPPGLFGLQMRAARGDLLIDSKELDKPDLFSFNVVVMSAALHHVENPEKMIEKLAQRLAPGGSFVIVDGVTPSESGCRIPPLHPAVQYEIL
ncbi:hypothetical protein BR93DRAFT_971321 [Coniochaeta sp. PMI_546]|nr:hypothetical protein BR93DRAFT_971321 [Coniochaeta sp. PMI_546]